MATVATSVIQGQTDLPTYHQIPETKYERKKGFLCLHVVDFIC